MRFSLLELLRRRRGLRPTEVTRLLADLPAMADAQPGFGNSGSWLVQIEIELPDGAGSEWLKRDVTQWPAFALRLFTPDESETGSSTMIERSPRATADAASRLAALLYELLGGRRRDGAAFTPLPALNEEANSVLRRALSSGRHGSCSAFWAELLQTLPPDSQLRAPAMRRLEIPGALRAARAPGRVLTLTPEMPETPPIRLVARSQFLIGRSRQRADYVTRLLPKDEANTRLTAEISRIHASGELRDGVPWLRDGTAAAPSANGIVFRDHEVPAGRTVPLTESGILQLATYLLEVVPILHPPLAQWDLAHLSETPDVASDELAGAVIFVPRGGQPVSREAVWMFSGVGFSLPANGALAWATGGEETGAFLHVGGCFWLANGGCEPGALRSGEIALATGEVAPLSSGSALQLGGMRYTVTVE